MSHSFVFLDESGLTARSQQPVLAIGMYRVADTSKITQELYGKHFNLHSEQARKRKLIFNDLEVFRRALNKAELSRILKSTSHHEFHFSELDRFNIRHYKDLIDTVFNYPLYFSCLVLDKAKYHNKSGQYDGYWEAYLEYSKILITSNIKHLEHVSVIADFATKPAMSEDTERLETVLNNVRGVDNVLCAHSESFILLQVTDLFLGAVAFMMKQSLGYISGSKNEKAKLEFTEYIFKKLNFHELRPINKYKFDL